jgi:hypothetical protein
MRRTLAALAVFSSAVFAQGATETRVFPLVHIDTPPQIQETVNAIRSIAEIREVAADMVAHRLVITGDAEQLAFADWIVKGLDISAGARPTSFTVRDTNYRDPRNATSVKLMFPGHIASPQSLQEAVNGVRTIGDVQRVVAFTVQKALLIRGTPEQTALSEWLLQDLDTSAAGAAPRETRRYTYTDTLVAVAYRSAAVRVYHPTEITTPQQMQEAINGLRSIAEVQRVTAFTAGHVIALRGAESQAEVADWLEKELDQPASAASPRAFAMPGDSAQTVHTFYLPNAAGPQDLQNSLNIIRQTTGIQRAVMYQRNAAIILRGTPEQVERASGLLR